MASSKNVDDVEEVNFRLDFSLLGADSQLVGTVIVARTTISVVIKRSLLRSSLD